MMKGTELMLKKVQLSLETGEEDNGNIRFAEKNEYTTIFGGAASGITPFESAIAQLKIGEEVTLKLTEKEMRPTFGPLWPEVSTKNQLTGRGDATYLRIRLLVVTTPEPSEVVQFLSASMKQGGCSCGGGCGCG